VLTVTHRRGHSKVGANWAHYDPFQRNRGLAYSWLCSDKRFLLENPALLEVGADPSPPQGPRPESDRAPQRAKKFSFFLLVRVSGTLIFESFTSRPPRSGDQLASVKTFVTRFVTKAMV
jgi:hypothetical protein